MWFVYILQCEDGSFYTGISNSPEKRFLEHKSGKGGRYTRSHKVQKMIYLEKIQSHSQALKREYQIKSWKKIKKIRELRLENTGM